MDLMIVKERLEKKIKKTIFFSRVKRSYDQSSGPKNGVAVITGGRTKHVLYAGGRNKYL